MPDGTWDTDKSTLSHPSEYAFCTAEEEQDNPWRPLHEDRGCSPGSDAVTVVACEGPHSVFCYGAPEEMPHVLADSLCALGNNNVHVLGQTLVVLNPLNAEEFARRGLVQGRRAPLPLGERPPGGARRARGNRPPFPCFLAVPPWAMLPPPDDGRGGRRRWQGRGTLAEVAGRRYWRERARSSARVRGAWRS
jgi:hypothetical protein